MSLIHLNEREHNLFFIISVSDKNCMALNHYEIKIVLGDFHSLGSIINWFVKCKFIRTFCQNFTIFSPEVR